MLDDRILPPASGPTSIGSPSTALAHDNSIGAGHLPPSAPLDDEVSLRDLWHVLYRNKWLIVTLAVIGVMGAAFYAKRATPVYQSGTSIRIDEKQSKIAGLEMLNGVGTGSELATEMEVLRSRALAETVVDSLELQVSVLEPTSARRNQLFSVLSVAPVDSGRRFVLQRAGDGFRIEGAGSRVYVPGERIELGPASIILQARSLQLKRLVIGVSSREVAVASLGARLAVSRPARDANVVVVRFQGPDPEIVRDVPNVLAQNFILRRNTVKTTESRSTIRFLRQQIDTLSRQLAESEESLRAFREGAQVVSLPEEASSQVKRLATVQAERSAIDAERSALSALLREVTAAAAVARVEDPSPFRRLLAFPTLLRNPAISQLLASLNAVESERTSLLIRRTAKDPDVITLTVRVREMEEQIRSLATTYLQGLTNQVASIDAELGKFNILLQQVPAKEVAYARLTRRPKVLEGVYTMLQERLKEAEIVQAIEDPSVRVVDVALLPTRPIKPNKPLIVLMGGMLGLMTGVGGAFLRKSLDHNVRSRDDVMRITGVPVLGFIPRMDKAMQRPLPRVSLLKRLASMSSGEEPVAKLPVATRSENDSGFAPWLVTGHDPRNAISEAYRSLRTNIMFSRMGRTPKTLVFTSPMPGDGKTTSASNLAVTLAQQGLKVLLIDADMRRGALNEVFRQPRDPGLSNVIMASAESRVATHRIALDENIAIDLLTTGTLPPNPAELVGSDRMRALLSRLQEEYDTIIIDSPPLNLVTDAALLGTKVDGVLLVTRVGKTSVHELEYAMSQLAHVRAPVLGIVLNDVVIDGAAGYGYGGYGGYY